MRIIHYAHRTYIKVEVFLRIIADMHTHTIASGHGYSTVNELVQEAAQKGLLALAITDHGPALPGGPHAYHFGAMRFIPAELLGVRILRGVEANIVDDEGHIDLEDTYLEKLDFVMAGLHDGCGFDCKGIDGNTRAVVNAMANPRINCISHPGNPAFPLHLQKIVEAAVATGTALEVNNSSFIISRKGSRPYCELLAGLIARGGARVMIGSDAHIAQGVGIFDEAMQVVTAAGIPEGNIINASLPRLLNFLGLSS